MALRNSDSRLQSIGASFAVHYYTILVKTPETLASLYAPSAHVVHRFKKANGAAELSSLLTALTAEGITSVKIDEIMTTPTTTGAIKVTVKGIFVSASAAAQAFTQDVELRELQSNTYAITSDRLTYAAAASAGRTAWTAETPDLKAVAEPMTVPSSAAAAAAAKEEEEAPATAAAPPAEAARESPAPAAAEAAAEEAAPAPEPVAPVKKPASFAEALRLKKVGDGAAFSNTVVRVTDKIKTAEPKNENNEKAEKKDRKEKAAAVQAATGNGHKKREEKPSAPTGASAAPAKPKKPHTSGPVIFYDVIIKELPESTTEEEVRAYVTPVAPVTLVNLVKSEKRRRAKEAATGAAPAAGAAAPRETITFAFVQLERPADASATHAKDVVAKLTALHKDMRIEEVREKKPIAAGAKKPHAGGANGATAPRKPREAAAASA